eukprot:308171-Rhodomonas_salina.1
MSSVPGSQDPATRTRKGSNASEQVGRRLSFASFTSWLSGSDQKDLVGSCTISLDPRILSQNLA